MEDFVVSDLAKSAYIVNAAILDDNGFIVAAQPDDDKSKDMLAKLTEIHYITDQSPVSYTHLTLPTSFLV